MPKGVKVKYFLIKGRPILERNSILLERGEEVEEKGSYLPVVVDENNREAARHYIARGSIVKVQDNTHISKGALIASPKSDDHVVISDWDPYSEPIIAEADGVVKFQDIIVGVTAVEQFDELTPASRLTLNEYIPSTYKPAIVLL